MRTKCRDAVRVYLRSTLDWIFIIGVFLVILLLVLLTGSDINGSVEERVLSAVRKVCTICLAGAWVSTTVWRHFALKKAYKLAVSARKRRFVNHG